MEQNTNEGWNPQENVPPLQRNIILTGYMGAGKSTVGRLLAGMLERKFIETDEMIATAAGLEIPEIFAQYGETSFRDRESAVLGELEALPQGSSVISTGGGAVLRPENVAALRRSGVIIFLEVGPAELYRRLKNTVDRPLLQDGCMMVKITSLLEKRRRAYLDCDYLVRTEGKTPVEIAGEILEMLEKRRE